jgi:hypothetical protein
MINRVERNVRVSYVSVKEAPRVIGVVGTDEYALYRLLRMGYADHRTVFAA